jgi:hypothetical protein
MPLRGRLPRLRTPLRLLVLRRRMRRWRPWLRLRCVRVRRRLHRLRTASTWPVHEHVHWKSIFRLGWRLRRWWPRIRVWCVVRVRHRLLRLRHASTAAAAATACAPVHQRAAPRPGACLRSLWKYGALPGAGARVCARARPSTRFRPERGARGARGVRRYGHRPVLPVLRSQRGAHGSGQRTASQRLDFHQQRPRVRACRPPGGR